MEFCSVALMAAKRVVNQVAANCCQQISKWQQQLQQQQQHQVATTINEQHVAHSL